MKPKKLNELKSWGYQELEDERLMDDPRLISGHDDGLCFLVTNKEEEITSVGITSGSISALIPQDGHIPLSDLVLLQAVGESIYILYQNQEGVFLRDLWKGIDHGRMGEEAVTACNDGKNLYVPVDNELHVYNEEGLVDLIEIDSERVPLQVGKSMAQGNHELWIRSSFQEGKEPCWTVLNVNYGAVRYTAFDSNVGQDLRDIGGLLAVLPEGMKGGTEIASDGYGFYFVSDGKLVNINLGQVVEVEGVENVHSMASGQNDVYVQTDKDLFSIRLGQIITQNKSHGHGPIYLSKTAVYKLGKDIRRWELLNIRGTTF